MASCQVRAGPDLGLRCASESVYGLLKAGTLRAVASQLALLVPDHLDALALGGGNVVVVGTGARLLSRRGQPWIVNRT